MGVTGLPSDEAVVDSEVSADGGDPAGVDRVTIGFNAVSSLAAGKVDAATGFWNAEGVALREQGVPIRVFKVDEYGAPPYPELVLATSRKTLEDDPGAGRRGRRGDDPRLRASPSPHPARALDDLIAVGQEPRPRRTGGPAARPAARPPPRPVRPRRAPRLGAVGPRARPARAPLDVDAAFDGDPAGRRCVG